MSGAFKVIIIDPIKREVRAERLRLDDLRPLYATMKTDIVQVVYPDALGGETLWIDEEGKQKPNHHFLLRTWEHDTLAGVCVISGDGCDTAWSPEEIEEFISWVPSLDGEQLLV